MKKTLIMGAVAIALSVGLGIGVQAYPHQGGDFIHGINAPGNGYQFGWAYFQHNTKQHWSRVYQNGTAYNDYAFAGDTSKAHSPSVESWKVYQTSFQAGF